MTIETIAQVSAEVRAKIVELATAGKAAGVIAMQVKAKRVVVEAVLAEQAGTAQVEGTQEQVVQVQDASGDMAALAQVQPDGETASKLAQMVAAQAAQAAAATPAVKGERKARASTTTLVKVETSSSKDAEGNNVQRRNTNCPVRAVAVFFSKELNLAWLGTHLAFGTKTAPAAMKVMVGDTATKCLLPLQDLEKAKPGSVEMVIEARDVAVGPELEAAKLNAYVKYRDLGFTMLGRDLAKSADAAAAKAAKDAAKAAKDAATAQPAPVQTEAEQLAAELATPEADALAVAEAELLAAELAQDAVEA